MEQKQKPKRGKKNTNPNEIEAILSDPRFSHVHEDPRLRNAPASQRKVKLDERFKSVLKNELFSEKASMDPRGRPKNFHSKEDYEKFYDVDSSDDDSSDNASEDTNDEDANEDTNDEDASEDADDEDASEETNDDDAIEDTNDDDTIKIANKEKTLSTNNKSKVIKSSLTGKKENCFVNPNDDSSEDEDARDETIKKVCKKKTLTSSNNSSLLEKKKKNSKKKKVESPTSLDNFSERLLNLDVDVTRGAGLFSDDSSDDDSSTTDDDDGDAYGEFEWGELDHDAKWDVDDDIEETSRFAVCNMDFDQVKAVDLLVLFSSFAPVVGKVNKVAVYLSEFGKQRLTEEDAVGPPELANFGGKDTDVDSDLKYLDKITKGTLEETTKPSAKYTEALRRYQRNRLKYYYAVVECDHVNTAKVIYKECDRMPYEVGGCTLDLRYIPSEMNFDDEVVHDSCGSLPSNYVSEAFQTTTLLDSNPTLTWDVTDRSRAETLSNAMSKAIKKQSYDYEKLQSYVADSSSGEETNENEDCDDENNDTKLSKNNRIAKFRALMDELEEKENKKTELQIDKEETFEINEKFPIETVSAKENEVTDAGLTPFEKYLVKRKEKRKDKGKKSGETEEIQFSDDELPEDAKDIASDPFFASDQKSKKKSKRGKKKDSVIQLNSSVENDGELNLMMMEEEEEEVKHFNMRKIFETDLENNKKKKKAQKRQIADENQVKPEEFKIDLSDPRFAAITKSRDFNIDPSHPQYVPTKAMNTLAKQTQDKRVDQNNGFINKAQTKRSRLKDDVSQLVKKIKLKVKEVNNIS